MKSPVRKRVRVLLLQQFLDLFEGGLPAFVNFAAEGEDPEELGVAPIASRLLLRPCLFLLIA